MDDFDSFNWEGCQFGDNYRRSIFEFCKQRGFKKGLEVGFDSGSSALAFLRACPDATLLSVDIGECNIGQALIAGSEVKDRHTFKQADSRTFLDDLGEHNEKFDYVYIDGDHLYDVVLQDLEKAPKLLAEGGVVLVDDVDPLHTHFGVYQAVREFCEKAGFTAQPLAGSPSCASILTKI